ncbi:16S rRNA processing protein RimM [Litoribacter ruber]|uniref:ribosome maturation factor RimM n=1 Tax=Litoribacter ruber TaxID=702568 RepID=UPI001BDB683D|nr:ribosome maturation factor RimM [Litoribacter ruber]MBT0809788.1 16S rRNA processing protein RimM [Litoribacter ruber]
MNKDNCFQIGYISKVHGLHGEVTVKLDVDDPSQYEDLGHVFLEQKGRLVPYFLEHFVYQTGGKVLAKFEEYDDVNAAGTLVGAGIFLPLNVLPELEDDQYYYHELIGFTVIDENHGELGEIKVLYDLQTQDLIGLDYKGKEVLIPIQDGIITKVDKAEKKVYCHLPEGLLDIYLED